MLTTLGVAKGAVHQARQRAGQQNQGNSSGAFWCLLDMRARKRNLAKTRLKKSAK